MVLGQMFGGQIHAFETATLEVEDVDTVSELRHGTERGLHEGSGLAIIRSYVLVSAGRIEGCPS